jgi:zinc transport system substrate-binding protein
MVSAANRLISLRRLTLLGLVALLAGCGGRPTDKPAVQRKLPTFAGIPPLAYLVEQIGGEHVKVDTLVQPGQDPHTFEPTPQQILALGRAAVFFKIDMPFEQVLLDKVREGNQRLVVVDATAGITKRTMDVDCCEHGLAHQCHDDDAGEPDPHVWLSPPLLKVLATNICKALCEADPSHSDDFKRNQTVLSGRLDTLDRQVRHMLAPYRGCWFYVFHPGFAYFADAYQLKQEAVEAGGRLPAPKQFHALVEKARTDGVKTVFVQPQYAPSGAQVVADAIGGKVVPINGLAKDVVADIEEIAAKIADSLKDSRPRGVAQAK